MDTWNTEVVDKQEVFDRFADVIKAIGSGRRLQLLEILAQGEHSVEALAQMAGMAITTTSNNLQTLKRSGLVVTRRDGTSIIYRLAGNDVLELFVAAKRVALRRSPALATSLQSYLEKSSGTVAPTLDPTQVTDDMYVIDVRPQQEYDAGHFPGAVSIPMDEIAQRYTEVPRDVQVVIYCRGELCRFAREAADFLRERGFDARAMDEGITEWRATKEISLDIVA